MKNIILVTISLLTLAGCSGSSGTTDSNSSKSTNNNPSTTSHKKFQAVAPLRYLAENYKNLDDAKIAKYLKTLSKKDADFLGSTYSAFARYLQYKGCNADKTLIVLQEPNIYYVKPVEVNCDQNDALVNDSIQLLQSLGNYKTGDEFKKANSDAGELVVVIKCDTGEIDKGTCALYWKGVASINNAQSDFYKQMADQNSEFTKQLTNQCTYDAEQLSNGAVCVANY